MGKTKLLMEVRKTLERVNLDTITEDGKHAFHLFYGIADIANKALKLHPWRRIMHDLFAVDLHCGVQLGTGGSRALPQVGVRSHALGEGLPCACAHVHMCHVCGLCLAFLVCTYLPARICGIACPQWL